VVRWAAIRRLTDQAALAGIARNGGDPNAREAAVSALTDRDLLAGAARDDRNPAVLAAGKRLSALAAR